MSTGEAVLTIGHWVVVKPLAAKGQGQFVVIDTSVTPPVQVHGPTTRGEAEAYARVNAGIFSAVYGQTPDV